MYHCYFMIINKTIIIIFKGWTGREMNSTNTNNAYVAADQSEARLAILGCEDCEKKFETYFQN